MMDTRTSAVFSLLLCAAMPSLAQETAEPPSAPAAEEDKGAAPTKELPQSAPKSSRVMDRLELESTAITGNRELPKVLYIVPWKKSDLGDLAGRPANSLLDEVLAPVDREVFRRQTEYYENLNSGPAAAPTQQESE